MDAFTIFLIVVAGGALVATVYGLIRPRRGPRVDLRSGADGDATNRARLGGGLGGAPRRGP